MSKIAQRISKETGIPDLVEILAERITPTDLQSLMIEVYGRIAKRRIPRKILADYVGHRLTQPSRLNPSKIIEWDHVAFSNLPKGFETIELSPTIPLGSVSSIAPVSQDWILTTIRNTEVISDPTNALALECAVRRQKLTRKNPADNSTVNLACSHRVLRAQRYQDPKALAHFRLLSLCSAGRDTGNFRFEKASIAEHVRFYRHAITQFIGHHTPLRVTFNDLSPGAVHADLLTEIIDGLAKELPNTRVELEESKSTTRGYYQQFRFHIHAEHKGKWVELVDGGDTDWTRKLLNNAKERLVTSGIGSERLCETFASSSS